MTALATASAHAEPAPTTRPAFNPISYYQAECSSCHGSYGSGYLPELIGRRSDAELRAIIEEMTVGPAQAPIDEAALEALVAYHRSLIRGEPFLSRSTAGGGEVTPGATVVTETDGKQVEAKVEQHAWTTPQATGDGARIVAEIAGQRTVLEPGERHSHAQPLEDRDE